MQDSKYTMVEPVEQDNLYFIHNIPDLIPNSIEISNGIYWGGDFESTKELINSGIIGKNNIRFFLGYTGWEEKTTGKRDGRQLLDYRKEFIRE